MIKKEIILQYFEEELENMNRLTILLYRDKKLLNEGKYGTFAKELLGRSKKAYIGSVLMVSMFSIIGIMYFFDSLLGPVNIYIGMLYLAGAFLGLHFATKEYYKIRASMTLLMILLGDEVNGPNPKAESEVSISEVEI